MEFLLIAALLPAIGLMAYVYHKDTVEKEPMNLVIRVFVLGAVAGPIAAVLEIGFEAVLSSILAPGLLFLILENFIGVAAIEEGLKYAAMATVRKNPAFNYVFDGIVYGAAAALGFAALENVLYVISGGLETALVRAIFSVPGHCVDGVVMGCFFGLAKQREHLGNKSGARTFYWLAFLLPTIEHGFYDCALSTESDLMVLVALGFQLAFIIFGMILVNRMSKYDTPIVSSQPLQTTPLQAQPQQVQPQQYPQQPPYQPTVQQYKQPMPNQQFQQQAPYAQPQQQVPYQQPQQMPYQQPQQVAAAALVGQWICPRCGNPNAGKFCGECGQPRPQ